MNIYYKRDDIDKDGTGSRHSIYGLKEMLECHPAIYIISFLFKNILPSLLSLHLMQISNIIRQRNISLAIQLKIILHDSVRDNAEVALFRAQ